MSLTKAQKEAIKKQLAEQKKRIPKQGEGVEYPEHIERAYNRELQKLVRKLEGLTARALNGLIAKEFQGIRDAKDPVLSALRALQRRFTFTALATQAAADMVNATDRFNRAKFVADIKKEIGVDANKILSDKGLRKLIDDRIKDNVDLIKTIPKEYFTRVRMAITQGREKDDTAFSIRKNLQEIGKVTERRAQIIARDQVSKTNAALNELRQQDVGVTHYFWRTSEDERVRDDHEANNGERFAWAHAPATGHPGEAVMCRCTADPDYSFLKAL